MPYIPYGYQPGYYGQAMPDQLAQLRQNAYQLPTMPGQATQQATPSIIWVQGEEGAKAYMVAAGNSVLLMDSENSSFYIKSTDASGMPLPLRGFGLFFLLWLVLQLFFRHSKKSCDFQNVCICYTAAIFPAIYSCL